METKYYWSGVPEDVKWISTDWEGWKLFHTSIPTKNDNTMSFDSIATDSIGYNERFWR